MSSIPECRNLSGVQQGNEHGDTIERSSYISRLDKMEKLILSAFIVVITLFFTIFIGLVILLSI
jgi:hypothetical protein